jgi:hypothetical protein
MKKKTEDAGAVPSRTSPQRPATDLHQREKQSADQLKNFSKRYEAMTTEELVAEFKRRYL